MAVAGISTHLQALTEELNFYIYFKKLIIFIYLAELGLSCGSWDL